MKKHFKVCWHEWFLHRILVVWCNFDMFIFIPCLYMYKQYCMQKVILDFNDLQNRPSLWWPNSLKETFIKFSSGILWHFFLLKTMEASDKKLSKKMLMNFFCQIVLSPNCLWNGIGKMFYDGLTILLPQGALLIQIMRKVINIVAVRRMSVRWS